METSTAKEPVLLEVRVRTNWESYQKYYRFVAVRNPLFWFLLLFLLSLLPMVAALVWITYHFTFFGVIFGVALIYAGTRVRTKRLLFGIVPLFAPWARRAYAKNSMQHAERGLIYTFYRDHVQAACIEQQSTDIETVRYEDINAVYEVEDAFYIQPVDNNHTVHVLAKQYFTPVQIKALQKLFTEQFGKSTSA